MQAELGFDQEEYFDDQVQEQQGESGEDFGEATMAEEGQQQEHDMEAPVDQEFGEDNGFPPEEGVQDAMEPEQEDTEDANAGAGGMEGELESFIAVNCLDSRAADKLRSCPPAVQDAVLARGDLTDARNPSSAVLGRIKDAMMVLTEGASDL